MDETTNPGVALLAAMTSLRTSSSLTVTTQGESDGTTTIELPRIFPRIVTYLTFTPKSHTLPS